MRKFAAHYIFPSVSSPIRKGIVQVDSTGMITHLIDRGDDFAEEAGLEFHNGIICPSFINLLEELPLKRFWKLFPELETYESLIPQPLKGEKAVFEWMKQIHISRAPVSLEHLLKLFTMDAAKAIGLSKEMGSLSVGKRPGINVISGIDFGVMLLRESSSLKKLI